MSLVKFESMLKTNSIYFFDLVEFEEIIIHYLDVGKVSLAKKALQLGLEQHPASVDLKLLQVELYLIDNEVEKASKLLKRIAVISPNNDEVYIQKATIASKKGMHKEAIIALEKALTLTNDPFDIWSLLGMEHLYLDNFKSARTYFIKCLEEDLEDYAALYNIVYCFDMDEKHEESIDYLNSYVDKNPYCEVAWHQLGRQFFILKNYKEALIAFDYAVLVDESFIGGYLEKAKTLEELGNYKEAIDNYLITLELDDATAYAYVRIGQCYEKLLKLDTAISYYKKAVHEDPLLDKAWILLTNCYYIQENYAKAAHYLAKAIEIDGDNELYWRRYAEINIKLNFCEEAIVGYRNCLQLGDISLEIYVSLADVLSFLGEFKEALRCIVNANKLYKNIAELEYRLAGLYYVMNKEGFAKTHLINGLNIDFEYYTVLNQLFPSIASYQPFQKLIADYKKATE
ncbi:tetratricopeptide repeat protein [uncultured Polaribacter sp.]|uniref:tetratricopeptide repeat protein n=1 Tax=uncultured Polaribacter sp. TaxID=174711 RepID=UPI0026324D25|nr:tetratricopeptide repeat protein [uncultured Polaribacter sp.]